MRTDDQRGPFGAFVADAPGVVRHDLVAHAADWTPHCDLCRAKSWRAKVEARRVEAQR